MEERVLSPISVVLQLLRLDLKTRLTGKVNPLHPLFQSCPYCPTLWPLWLGLALSEPSLGKPIQVS